LLGGLAARHRDDCRAQRFDAGVSAEAACKQPVPVGVVYAHPGSHSRCPERASDETRPDLEVALRVTDDGRQPGRARRRVDARDLLGGHRKHAERIVLAQVILRGEGQLFEVIQRPDVVGMYAGGVELRPVVRHVRVGVTHGLLQAIKLKRLEFVARHPLGRILLVEAGGAQSGLGRSRR
jgi:hypothetical protein